MLGGVQDWEEDSEGGVRRDRVKHKIIATGGLSVAPGKVDYRPRVGNELGLSAGCRGVEPDSVVYLFLR